MAVLAKSRLTAQGQISVPAEVRKRLGIGPGSIVEWQEEEGHMTVRRSGTYTFEDIHRVVFKGKKPKPVTVEEMDEGIAEYVRKHYAGS